VAPIPAPDDLFGRYHRDIHRYLARMCGRRDVADDLSQEVFLRAINAARNGHGAVGHERGWIFAIARSVLVDHHRREGHQAPGGDPAAEPVQDGDQHLVLELAQSLGRLSEPDREVFLLKEVGGLSYQEIAALCECTVDGVRARLYRTCAALRAMLSL
jgi:RNA polymerase sigma-70 factor (ECF subfamily)